MDPLGALQIEFFLSEVALDRAALLLLRVVPASVLAALVRVDTPLAKRFKRFGRSEQVAPKP